MTPFVKCNATSEGEPVPTSDMVERAAMTDDFRSFNIYTRHHESRKWVQERPLNAKFINGMTLEGPLLM